MSILKKTFVLPQFSHIALQNRTWARGKVCACACPLARSWSRILCRVFELCVCPFHSTFRSSYTSALYKMVSVWGSERHVRINREYSPYTITSPAPPAYSRVTDLRSLSDSRRYTKYFPTDAARPHRVLAEIVELAIACALRHGEYYSTSQWSMCSRV